MRSTDNNALFLCHLTLMRQYTFLRRAISNTTRMAAQRGAVHPSSSPILHREAKEECAPRSHHEMLLFLFIFQQKQITMPSSNGWERFKASFATRRTAVWGSAPSFALASCSSVLLLLTSVPFPDSLNTPLFLPPLTPDPTKTYQQILFPSRHKLCSLGLQSAGDTQGCT